MSIYSHSTDGKALSVESLAAAKRLPADFLRGLDLADAPDGVAIPYYAMTGEPVFCRTRLALGGPKRFRQPIGVGLEAYGQWKLDEAARAGFLVIVEGESDCWALWHHDLPALGLPGSNTAKTLEKEHVQSVGTVYISRETDAGGKAFVEGVTRRLAELGFTGKVYVLTMPDDLKDPADLHAADPELFLQRFQKAIESSSPVLPPGPSANGRPPEPEDPDDELEIPEPPWPDPPANEAFYGLAGDIVRVIEPASEADPAALLVQTLVAFGNVVGRRAYFSVEADRHFPNEFAVLVGKTSKARKGTRWSSIDRLFAEVDPEWTKDRVQTGLSSGEGLIWNVRDAIRKRDRIREKKQIRYEEVEADPGVSDKRLLVVEPEFANVLKQTERQGNTLSATLRQAWDGRDLRTMTKNSPARATGAHVSLIGHITADELRRYLTQTETANGFANRHLFVCTGRSKILPDGGRVDADAWESLRNRLTEALLFSSTGGQVERDNPARNIWFEVYGPLSEGKPGLAGALLARGEAHVCRLALLFALMDCSVVIRTPHLEAALAVWDYCEGSVYHLFGDCLGDPLADDILQLLRACPGGMTRWEINNALGRNVSSDKIGRSLGLLLKHRLARMVKEQTARRPTQRWFAGGRTVTE
jgi:hypothetical protein